MLRYPYSDKKAGRWKQSLGGGEAKQYYLANKWNGMNVLFFKYQDNEGRIFVTGKSKGSASIMDMDVGSTISTVTAH